jgi:carbon monoxide dehydrogenase subunit G
MKLVFGIAAFVALSVVAADAHGPTRQKLVESVDIDRPVDKVWAIVKDFDSIAKWHPAVASSVATKGDEVGSVRTVVLKAPGDPKLIEALLSYDDAAHTYHYEIQDVDVKVLPVQNYTSWLTVKDNGHGGSRLEWKGAFYRGDQRNDPPPELNDDAALAAVKGVYQPGLDNVKKIAESQ